MLSRRLEQIISAAGKCNSVADIGTDHGYIPISLIKRKMAYHVTACDIIEGPLKIAKSNIKQSGYENCIEIKKSDGLKQLDVKRYDLIIIAGMGGHLISNIISNSIKKINLGTKFVIQPMTAIEVIKRYLIENGFEIEKEFYIKEDKRPYVVFKVIYNRQNNNRYNEIDIYTCKKEINDISAYKLFIEKTIRRQNKILYGLKCKKNIDKIEKQIKLVKELTYHYENL